MPVVAVSAKRLNDLLGKEYEMNVLVHALEQLGCDVEDTAILNLYICPVCQTPNDKLESEDPPKRCDYCGHEGEEYFELYGSDKVIRIDLLADRPDLFDSGGLSRALKGFLDLEKGLPELTAMPGNIEVHIDKALSSADSYRPYIVCAVVTMPPLDQNSLREVMRLQENLHWGIGRDRKLASIGVYDMDSIAPPIRYSTVDPKAFTFHPLGMPDTLMTPEQVLTTHPKGVAYAHLMEPYKRYPILIDAKDLVLSMPPIINSDETKCKIGTTCLFVDVTGTVESAPVDSINTLISALIEIGGKVETVQMHFPERTIATPDLTPGTITISYEESKRWLGLEYTREEMIAYLEKMRFSVTPAGERFEVKYPAFRTDMRHEVDVFEDLAIGYGYERIEPKLVPNLTIGKARKEEELSQLVRDVMIGLGFTEIMSLHLNSIERHFTKFGMEPGENHIIVSNPKTIEQKIARSHLMTGIMETFNKNRRKTVPQCLFEIGNILLIDSSRETGVSEYRHIAFSIIGPATGYAEIRMNLDALLHELRFSGDYKPVVHPSFCEGRCAEVTNDAGLWALLGEIHPQVLNNFSLTYTVSICELRLLKVI
ncbi:MAG: phenylalanine--tRNA ligase subunit beta [Candidatus Fischerbacteria bacterium RBG_13_37_8]|uniref:phenylalanine--tRNA ligase n=1 Tax=Candidatus Fischerbacteria bacterium RBG_13_37_8 TaxID=1817863 RepID=A0A1F5VIB0_9BACT|nr:MAG: phenylalanine--tRNA ligase subunit beta [Candidatus Fischerbacteria bacterium RBG_13_37_8]